MTVDNRPNMCKVCYIVEQRDDLLDALKEGRGRLTFLHNAIRGETKPIFEDIEIRKTGDCIVFMDEAITEAETAFDATI